MTDYGGSRHEYQWDFFIAHSEKDLALAEEAAAREGTTPGAVQKRNEGKIPMARMGVPEEFGAAVAFLASERAS